MNGKNQFGAVLAFVLSLLVAAFPVNAQKPHSNPAPAAHPAPSHAAKPPANPKPQQHPNANANSNAGNNHPVTSTDRPPANNNNPNRPPVNSNPANNNRPAGANAYQNNFANPNRPNTNTNLAPRQQAGGNSAARPWVDTMRSLTPQQRERVLQNSKAFQNLSPDKQAKIRQQFNQWDRMSPQQREDLQQKERVWSQLTPQQQQHLKTDVIPKFNSMPWDRQQVIKQKLGTLQNMPESARNQRLADPNFTKGMSDDEKSMLNDLSHTHVGAPPEQ